MAHSHSHSQIRFPTWAKWVVIAHSSYRKNIFLTTRSKNTETEKKYGEFEKTQRKSRSKAIFICVNISRAFWPATNLSLNEIFLVFGFPAAWQVVGKIVVVCQLAVTFVGQLSPEFYNVFKAFEWVSSLNEWQVSIEVGVACRGHFAHVKQEFCDNKCRRHFRFLNFWSSDFPIFGFSYFLIFQSPSGSHFAVAFSRCANKWAMVNLFDLATIVMILNKSQSKHSPRGVLN